MKELLLKCFEHFFAEHADILATHEVYGLTNFLAPEMHSIGCVIGTSESLNECLAEYQSLGYRNSQTKTTVGFGDWLKWSGPDETAWTGIYSTVFDEFNDKMTFNLNEGKFELYSAYLSDLVVDNIDSIRALLTEKNTPIICVYFEHDFELEDLNKKLTPNSVAMLRNL